MGVDASSRSGSPRARRLDTFLLFAAIVLPAVVTRVLLIGEKGVTPGPVDGLGLASDLAAGLVFLALVAPLARWAVVLLYPLMLLWTFIHYANYENVLELGSPLLLTHAEFLADETFLKGSALALKRPVLLLFEFALVLALTWMGARTRKTRSLRPVAGLGCLGLLLLAVLPADPETLVWRQRCLWLENLEALRSTETDFGEDDLAAAREVLRGDLSGEPLVSLPNPGTNVLLLVLEGVPGALLSSVAQAQGIESEIDLESLQRLSARGLTATNFVLQQRQTSRGLYALLAGDLPRLRTRQPKQTEYLLRGGSRRCLPQVLEDHGYRTRFMEGAPLSFNFKGQFMRAIGFEEVRGTLTYEDPIYRGFWGVDDRTLFRAVAEELSSLQAGPDPWFVAVLTVGTHHPVTIPGRQGFQGFRYRVVEDTDLLLDKLTAAFVYLDEALMELFANLEEQGVLEDTLVIVTADESRGIGSPNDDVTQMLSQNHGPMIALLPTQEVGTIEAPYGQSDLALSILDYLGIDPEPTEFMGRSIFREYDEPRLVYFSNTFYKRTGAVGDGVVYYCDEPGATCVKYRVDPHALFGPQRDRLIMDPAEFGVGRALISLSEKPMEAAGTGSLVLIPDDAVYPIGIEPVEWSRLHRTRHGKPLKAGDIFGRQALTLLDDNEIEISFVVSLRGGRGKATLVNALKEGQETRFRSRLPEMATGDRISVKYLYRSPSPLDFSCNLSVVKSEGSGLELEFQDARLTFRRLPEGEVEEPAVEGFEPRKERSP